MGKDRKNTVPGQGDRNLRSRRGAAIVPGGSVSSSDDGPTGGCPAGPPAEDASAKGLAVAGSSRKRVAAREEEPTKMRVMEKEDDQSSVRSDGSGRQSWGWTDIAEKDEKYLANNHEELYELIMQEETLASRLKELNGEDAWYLFETLFECMRGSIGELRRLQPGEGTKDPNKRHPGAKIASALTFQASRMVDMINDLIERDNLHCERIADLEKTLGECRKEEAIARDKWMKEMSEKNKLLLQEKRLVIDLQGELQKLKTERDKLLREKSLVKDQWGELQRAKVERDKLLREKEENSWKVTTRDASVSTETEIPDVDMEEVRVPPPLREIPQNLAGILGGIIEEKIEGALSRVMGKALGPSGPTDGPARPSRTGGSWSDVVAGKKRSKRTPPAPAGIAA